ncbi:MAG: phosphoesterase [Chloroflexota bacterium]|nr:MAG: phosphoesterase [Chloroflexota bacterium]
MSQVEAEELVLVVPRSAVMGDPGWHGVRTDDLDGFAELVAREGRFVPRSDAEQDRSIKQVVPYLILRDGSRTFLMRRTRAGADARLHDRFSIGVGGHLNPGDGDLAAGLRREWAEEIEAGFVPDFRLVGLLNDDTTDVGSVHLGAVYLADAEGRPVAIRETDKLSGAFAAAADVWAVVDRMETWSRLAWEHLEVGDSPPSAELAGRSGEMARGS